MVMHVSPFTHSQPGTHRNKRSQTVAKQQPDTATLSGIFDLIEVPSL